MKCIGNVNGCNVNFEPSFKVSKRVFLVGQVFSWDDMVVLKLDSWETLGGLIEPKLNGFNVTLKKCIYKFHSKTSKINLYHMTTESDCSSPGTVRHSGLGSSRGLNVGVF